MLISRSSLHEAVRLCSLAVATNGKVPILRTIHLDTKARTMRASRLDVSVTVDRLTFYKGEDGLDNHVNACVPAKPLTQCLNGRTDGDIDIRPGDAADVVVFNDGTIKRTLTCLPVDEFPVVAEAGEFTHLVDAWALAEALAKVAPAVTTDDTRFAIGGVLVREGEDGLEVVGTDGHRLHVAKLPLLRGAGTFRDCLVPRAAFRALSELDGEVWLGADEKYLHARPAPGNVTVTARELDGSFPNYCKVMPGENWLAVSSFDPKVWTSLLKKAKDVTDVGGATLLTPCASGVQVDVKDSTGNGWQATLPGVMSRSGEVDVMLNVEYLLDAISSGCNAMYFYAPSRQVKLTGPGVVSVIMPMRRS